MAISINSAQLADFSTMLKQARGEFQAESVTRARKYRLYFVKREALRVALSGIRNLVPAGTKATPVPSGVQAAKWKKLLDDLGAAEKLLREEAKKVSKDTPMPDPIAAPKTGTYTKRQRSRRKLKELLKEIYGKKKGETRYKFYRKLSKEAGQEDSPHALWAFFNGTTVDERVEARQAARAQASAERAGTGGEAAGAMDVIAPVDAATAGGAAGTQPASLMTTLWPTDKPIYARPAAIGGALLVAGVVGWVLLSPSKKPAARTSEKKPETKAP